MESTDESRRCFKRNAQFLNQIQDPSKRFKAEELPGQSTYCPMNAHAVIQEPPSTFDEMDVENVDVVMRSVPVVDSAFLESFTSFQHDESDAAVQPNLNNQQWPSAKFLENMRRHQEEALTLKIHRPDFNWPQNWPIFRVRSQKLVKGEEVIISGTLLEPDP